MNTDEEKIIEKTLEYYRSQKLAEEFNEENEERFDTEDNPESWEFDEFRLKKALNKAISLTRKDYEETLAKIQGELKEGIKNLSCGDDYYDNCNFNDFEKLIEEIFNNNTPQKSVKAEGKHGNLTHESVTSPELLNRDKEVSRHGGGETATADNPSEQDERARSRKVDRSFNEDTSIASQSTSNKRDMGSPAPRDVSNYSQDVSIRKNESEEKLRSPHNYSRNTPDTSNEGDVSEKKEYISQCCKSKIHKDQSDEGTFTMVCNKCGKDCDIEVKEKKGCE